MKFRLFQTKLGYSAVLFEDDIAKRIILPSTKEGVLNRVKSIAPAANETSTGVEDIVDSILDFWNGKDVSISMDRLDTSLCSPFQLR